MSKDTYLRSTMGNNRLHALMLVHVHNNILDNINLADVANQCFDRKGSRKKTFRHLSQNYLLELYFPYNYISYQIYKTWSCVTFYYSLNRFPPSK